MTVSYKKTWSTDTNSYDENEKSKKEKEEIKKTMAENINVRVRKNNNGRSLNESECDSTVHHCFCCLQFMWEGGNVASLFETECIVNGKWSALK